MGAYSEETAMLAMGALRFKTNISKAEEFQRATDFGGARTTLKACVEMVTNNVTSYLEANGTRRQGSIRPLLRETGAETVAYIGLKVMLDSIAYRFKLTATAIRIGRRIEDELLFRHMETQPRVETDALLDKVASKGNNRGDAFRKMAQKHADEPWENWPTRQRLAVGLAVLHCIEQAKLVERKHIQRDLYLFPTPQVLHAIEERNHTFSFMRPWFLPLTVPPKPWTSPTEGGYHTIQLNSIVIGAGRVGEQHGKEIDGAREKALEEGDLTTVYAGLNALQATPWKINRDVLETLRELWDLKFAVAGIPARDSFGVPPRPEAVPPVGSELEPWQATLLSAWKQAKTVAIETESRRRSRLIAARRILEVASMFEHKEELYYPYQVDWRGRAYAVPFFLNPQGQDLAKGILTFAHGKPLGTPEGAHWFVVHGANSFGVDKVSFEERRTWVYEHHEEIMECYGDPVSNLWWAESDSPWQFLAWIFEYGAWADTDYSLDFVSNLPIGMDGTANGLQHFSAMLRDRTGARAVNLMEVDGPEDIYTRVLDVVIRNCTTFVEADERPHSSLAKQWLQSGLLKRSAVKRQVMTLPYGATRYGMTLQLKEYLIGCAEKEELPFEDTWVATRWLTGVIHESIGEVVVAANDAMDWLQNAAREALEKDHRMLVWDAPSGFPVVQGYMKTQVRQYNTKLLGNLTVKYRERTDKVNKRKQAVSASPNFVHSLDAAHLLLTAAANHDLYWAAVHDSYGTLAADCPRLAQSLREEFVKIYETCDPLEDIRTSLKSDLPLPPKGDFDIREVLKADYFFA